MAVNPQAFEQFTLRQIRITENELGHGSYAVVMELEYRGLQQTTGEFINTVPLSAVAMEGGLQGLEPPPIFLDYYK